MSIIPFSPTSTQSTKFTIAPKIHDLYYITDIAGICRVRETGTLLRLPLGLLVLRSQRFAQWVNKSHIADIGKTNAKPFDLEVGSDVDYENFLSWILPLRAEDQTALSNRPLSHLRSILILTEYLGMDEEHQACIRALNALGIRPAAVDADPTPHPVYYHAYKGDGVMPFVVVKSNVLIRLPVSYMRNRSQMLDTMLQFGIPTSERGPLDFHYGTIEQWNPLLEYILPQGIPKTLANFSTADVISILHIAHFLDMQLDVAAAAAELVKRKDDAALTPAHALQLSYQFQRPELRVDFVKKLLAFPLHRISPEDVERLNSFNHPPHSTVSFFTAIAILHSKVTNNRDYLGERWSNICPASQECAESDEYNHNTGCAPTWEWVWRTRLLRSWLPVAGGASDAFMLYRAAQVDDPTIHPDCLKAMIKSMAETEQRLREDVWIAEFVSHM